MNKKITLFLMSEKGLYCLQTIIDTFGAAVIDVVITAYDQNVKNDYCDEITELCRNNSIPVYKRKPKPLGSDRINTDYAIAVSWRWLIETEKKLIVLHDSLLPKYCGFAPVVNALLNKEPCIGVTALLADGTTFDSGPIIKQERYYVDYPRRTRIQDIIYDLSVLYGNLCIYVVRCIIEGEIHFKSQDHTEATYSVWRAERDYKIDWAQSAEDIEHFINTVGYPYLGASSFADGLGVVRILEANTFFDVVIEQRKNHVGKVLFIYDDCPVVICGIGLIKLTRVEVNEQSVLPLKKFRTCFE